MKTCCILATIKSTIVAFFATAAFPAQNEAWFKKNYWVYDAELRALRAVIPTIGRGMEIGIGTARFAKPLGIKNGVDPSPRMREYARKRGAMVLDGVAEQLPFDNEQFV